MGRLLNLPDDRLADSALSFGFFEDFYEFVSGDLFTDTSADTGASWAGTDGAGGIVTGATGATDNNEAYLHTTRELFKFAADKPLIFEARLTTPQAATNAANFCVGLMDAVGADSILDNGAGPKASYSGAVIFAADGATTLNAESSLAGAQTTTVLNAAGSLDGVAKTTSSSHQTFRIEFLPKNSTQADILFYVDNVLVAKHTDFVFTSATEMQAFVGVKAGGANSEAPVVDYVACYQVR